VPFQRRINETSTHAAAGRDTNEEAAPHGALPPTGYPVGYGVTAKPLARIVPW